MSYIDSKLLNKTFEIVSEATKDRSRGIQRRDLDEILNLMRDDKRKNLERAKKLKIAGARSSQNPRKSDADDLRHYRDPFFSPPKTKSVDLTKEIKRKVSKKLPHSTIDYGEEQKLIRKKQNATVAVRMLYLAMGVAVLIAVGMST